MWLSTVMLLLASWAILADMNAAEASRLTPLRSKRMIGATLAPHVPWQAMIYFSDSLLDRGLAGGALISDRWILTSGRNLFVRKTRQDTQGKTPGIPKVYLGITGRAEATELNEVAVEKIVLHPGFQNHSDWDNDLALIQLKEPVVMSDKVTPIPLPERGQQYPNSGVITGWGFGTHFTFSPSLKFLVLPVVDCEGQPDDDPTLTVDENMFCTKALEQGQNICFGDSGSAFVVTDPVTQEHYAAGILSNDKACRSNRHAVYMKLSAYLPWIHSVIRGDTRKSAALRSQAMLNMSSQQQ